MPEKAQEEIIRNGWRLRAFRFFLLRFNELIENVERLQLGNPSGFHDHPETKLLLSVFNAINDRVPADPNHSDHRCATLENGGRWRRVKKGMPNRYRLFFQFSSDTKTIVYVWLNDELTLRKEGAKTDVYRVFLKHTSSGRIPASFEQLLRESEPVPKAGN